MKKLKDILQNKKIKIEELAKINAGISAIATATYASFSSLLSASEVPHCDTYACIIRACVNQTATCDNSACRNEQSKHK